MTKFWFSLLVGVVAVSGFAGEITNTNPGTTVNGSFGYEIVNATTDEVITVTINGTTDFENYTATIGSSGNRPILRGNGKAYYVIASNGGKVNIQGRDFEVRDMSFGLVSTDASDMLEITSSGGPFGPPYIGNFDYYTTTGDRSLVAHLTGNVAFNKQGTYTCTVYGTWSNDQGFNVNEGTVTIPSGQTSIGQSTARLNMGANAILNVNASNAFLGLSSNDSSATINVASGVTLTSAPTYGASYSSAFTGAGNLIFSSASQTSQLSGTSTLSGTVTLSNGHTLKITTGASFTSMKLDIQGSSELDVDTDFTIARLTGASASASVDVETGSHTLTFGDSASLVTYAGSFGGGSGSIEKAGSGEVALTGNNTLTGSTKISAGKLKVSSESALGNGSVSLNGGTLHVTGTTTSGQATSVDVDSTIEVDSTRTYTMTGVLSGANKTLTKSGAGTVVLNEYDEYAYRHIEY